MFIALILVPAVSLFNVGGINNLIANLLHQDKNFFSLLSGSQGFWPVFGLIMGGIGIGIGYPGQPHILTNFMSIKDPREIKDSTLIAMIWVGLTTYGAAIIGMVGRSLYPSIEDPEKIFLVLAKNLFPSYTLGIFAAAVMAAILSSVSAYLLVAAASFASNIYTRFVKVTNENQLIWVERLAVFAISILALLMSISGGLVFKIALYAWGGLAACFGPLVIFSLYWPKLNKTGAVWSMIIGMVTIILWYNLGLSKWLYELVPGFALSIITLFTVSKLSGGPDRLTEEKFLNYLSQIRR